MTQDQLIKAWGKFAMDNFEQLDTKLPEEKESEHFKSGLPPSPTEQRENLERVRKHRKDPTNRMRDNEKQRERRRNAPKNT